MADEWFYTNDGQQMGPVSIAGLRELAARGGLQPSDLVWTEGMSTWAPASASRGLFPSSTAPQSAPRDVPEVKPADRQRNRDPRRWDERDRRLERPTPPAGLSTGTKVLIGLGVAGLLAMVGMVAVLMMAGIIAETQAQQRSQNQRNRQFFGGGPGVANGPGEPINRVPPPANLKVIPPGQKSYTVNLKAENPVEGHLVSFTKGQQVVITVTTTKWDVVQGGLIDVDLYIYDSKGVLVAFDDGEAKDCSATFIPNRTENYTIVIHLCDGLSATCKVDY
jgi:hypothetical protein